MISAEEKLNYHRCRQYCVMEKPKQKFEDPEAEETGLPKMFKITHCPSYGARVARWNSHVVDDNGLVEALIAKRCTGLGERCKKEAEAYLAPPSRH